MKKNEVAGIIVYLLLLVLAFVFGIVVIRNYASSSGMDGGVYILFIIGAILAGVIFNAFLFEIAHVIGAKLGGYDIVSVSVLRLTWFKRDNKTHFHLAAYDGLTGETKIKPKENAKKEPNPTLYLINGTIFWAIEAIIIIFLFSFFTTENQPTVLKNIAYFLLCVLCVGGMILIYNIIPLHLDSLNDGYKLILFSNKENREAFNQLMYAENASLVTKIDNKEDKENKKNVFSGDLKLNNVYVLLNERKYEESEKQIDEILKENEEKEEISEKVYIRAKAEKLYIMIMNGRLLEAAGFYEAHVPQIERKLISEDISMVCVRSYLLVSSLIDKSHSECLFAIKHAYRAYKHTPMANQALEISLFNEALEKVNEKHPDWNLLEYKMEVSK